VLDFFYLDDSRQAQPSRDGLGPLTGLGFVRVPGEHLHTLERTLRRICSTTGFPEGAAGEFKWSPNKQQWMWENLRELQRREFFERILKTAAGFGAKAYVVITDEFRSAPAGEQDHMFGATRVLLEQIEQDLRGRERRGLVISDRPSGGRRDEDVYLDRTLEALQSGATFYHADSIALSILATPSRFVRSLQLADLVTSCTLAFVAGESRHAPSIFPSVKPLLEEGNGRKWIRVKLHPEDQFANLLHWLLQVDELHIRGALRRLPIADLPYAADPDTQ
jgi:hypothetical protein